MIDINELRRKVNSTDVVDHIDLHANIKTILSEMIDRVEAAESECLEESRLNGMGSEREAALTAKLEAAEQTVQDYLRIDREKAQIAQRLEAAEEEREELHALIAAVKKQANAEFRIRVKKEEACARLQAKIEALEQQKPVAWMSSRNGFICKENKNPDYNVPLYALPGAKGEGK